MTKDNVCPICMGTEFEDMDNPSVPCGLCAKHEHSNKDCQQCHGTGKFKITLRNYDYWFMQGFLYKEKVGFQVCRQCGFLNYAPRAADDISKKINSLPLAVGHIQLSRRKAMQLKHFLGNKLVKEKDVFEINCALGYTRKMFREDSEYEATENNPVFLSYAKRINGVKIADEPLKKYDLIIYNHFEWESDPRKALKVYADKLKDDGHLCLEIPIYDQEISNQTGFGARDFELLYHLSVQNCFSTISFDNLCGLAGLEIVKKESLIGKTCFLCRKTSAQAGKLQHENHEDIKRKLVRQAQAIGNFRDAWEMGKSMEKKDQALSMMMRSVDIYPWFLEGWIGISLSQEYFKNIGKLHQLYVQANKYMGDCLALKLHFANIFKNGGEPGQETQWIKLSRDLYEEIYAQMPDNHEAVMGLYYLECLFGGDFEKITKYKNALLDLIPDQYSAIMKMWIICNQTEGAKCG